MTPRFPQEHRTRLVRTLGARARIEAAPRAAIHGGPAAELDGDATAWSPEQLLLSSVGLAMITALDAFAAREKVAIFACEASVVGTVERSERGLDITRLAIEVDIEVDDAARARAALELARHHCVVWNALRVPVDVVAIIREAELKAG